MEKKMLKRGAWSYEEDRKLATYVKKYGIWNWNKMPKYAGLSRSGKSCRLRWMNYLRPDVKIGKFTEEEDETIIKMHEKIGNRWSEIARKLPGRTDNEIKNHWHTRLKKRLLSKKTMVNPAKACQEELIHKNLEGNNSPGIANDDRVAPVSGSLVEDADLIFWTQPFLMESSAMEYQQFGYGLSLQFDGFGPFESSCSANDICLDFLFSFSETEDILSRI